MAGVGCGVQTACNWKQLNWELQPQGTEGVDIAIYLLLHQDMLEGSSDQEKKIKPERS